MRLLNAYSRGGWNMLKTYSEYRNKAQAACNNDSCRYESNKQSNGKSQCKDPHYDHLTFLGYIIPKSAEKSLFSYSN